MMEEAVIRYRVFGIEHRLAAEGGMAFARGRVSIGDEGIQNHVEYA